jgi:hypothetical protein
MMGRGLVSDQKKKKKKKKRKKRLELAHQSIRMSVSLRLQSDGRTATAPPGNTASLEAAAKTAFSLTDSVKLYFDTGVEMAPSDSATDGECVVVCVGMEVFKTAGRRRSVAVS